MRRAHRLFVVPCLLFSTMLVVGVFASAADAAPGDLDTSFGTGGIVTSDLEEETGASDVAIQSDGRVVVAGSTGGCSESGGEFTCHSEFLIERYNSNGTLDTSFGGGDGIVTTGFGNESQGASSVLIESSGKLLVGGTTSENEESEFALARYNSDGSLDTTFGAGDGKATVSVSGTGLRMWSGSMVLQPGGKIVLGGEVGVEETIFVGEFHEETTIRRTHAALARLNGDGSLDTSFGTGGTAVGSVPLAHLFGLTETPGGKLVAAIRTGHYDFGVMEFDADGSLNTGFGNGGTAALELSPTGSQADDVLVQPDGKIVASGWGYRIAIARFNANGTPDSSFGGGDGLTYTDFNRPCCGSGAAIALALQADGRIAFSGQWGPDEDQFGTDDEWAVGRLYANGSPDTGFGTSGMTTTAVAGGGYSDYANALALQSDGKLVAAGGTGEAGNDLALVRYLGGSSPEPTFSHLLVAKSGEGIVFSGSGAFNCGVNCGENYPVGETVELNVFPESGSSFDGWSTTSGNPGTCTGMTSPCEVTLNGNVELVAAFSGAAPVQHVLTISKSGTGSGTVTSSPAGIACGATCSNEFSDGTEVTLTATPAAGSTFAGWSGGGCSGTGVCAISLAADAEVTATFTASETSSGSGSQTPTPTPTPTPSPTPEPTPTVHKKPLKCRKGFKKRKVHGKVRCVRVKRTT